MADTKSEMSLDEVLSSIKKMVVDSEPPVLDLTDMVAEDGSVVKVGEESSANGIGDFLRLAQENDMHNRHENINIKDDINFEQQEKTSKTNLKDDVMVEIFKDIAAPEVKRWLNANLPSVISDTVNQTINKWMQDNLSHLVGSIVEREIRNLLNRKS